MNIRNFSGFGPFKWGEMLFELVGASFEVIEVAKMIELGSALARVSFEKSEDVKMVELGSELTLSVRVRDWVKAGPGVQNFLLF